MKFFNRDLSWLSFNHRVLQEAADPTVPLFERIKFLAIFSSNLEEFFRVRVASLRSLKNLKHKTVKELDFDPGELLEKILDRVAVLQNEMGIIYSTQIVPSLSDANIFLKDETDLNPNDENYVKDYFREKVQPYINPMILVKKKVKPFLRSGVLYLAISLTSKHSKSKNKKNLYCIIEIPTDRIPRFVILPSAENEKNLMLLDDVIRYSLGEMFQGYKVEEVRSFKLTRDAELYIDDEFSGSLLEKIKKSLSKRPLGVPSRFLYDKQSSNKLLKFLKESLSLEKEDLSPGARYHSFSDFFNFPHPNIPGYSYEHLVPVVNSDLMQPEKIFEAISVRDHLLYFPYESFEPFINFMKAAANDPMVIEIKMTLYRVSKDSKIIKQLYAALTNGKKVTIFFEIKARFDEELNIEYARELEAAGAVVLYSIPGLKVHAKLCIVRRQEENETKSYSYLSTGNFNEKTAKTYSDFGLFTSDKRITCEAEEVFKVLEGKAESPVFKTLLVAQYNMKKKFMKLIDEEIRNAKKGKDAYVIIKLNSLEDRKMIEKLYESSKAGVRVQIIVRGICCLVPGIKGQSENINVISIVDMFLEHSRVFIFGNDGDEKIYLSSADWMKRNLNRRIELAFPVFDEAAKNKIKDIINLQLKDNLKARKLNKNQDNIYKNKEEGKALRSQTKTLEYIRDKANS